MNVVFFGIKEYVNELWIISNLTAKKTSTNERKSKMGFHNDGEEYQMLEDEERMSYNEYIFSELMATKVMLAH